MLLSCILWQQLPTTVIYVSGGALLCHDDLTDDQELVACVEDGDLQPKLLKSLILYHAAIHMDHTLLGEMGLQTAAE